MPDLKAIKISIGLALPGVDFVGPVEDNGKFIFMAYGSDPTEGVFDPYYSYDPKTGDISEFSLFESDNPKKISADLAALREDNQ